MCWGYAALRAPGHDTAYTITPRAHTAVRAGQTEYRGFGLFRRAAHYPGLLLFHQ